MNNIVNTKVGLTGWLSPDGEFKESEYGHHHEMANRLLEFNEVDDEDKFVGMGSKGIGAESLSYIFAPFVLTQMQKEWLLNNLLLLDEMQIYLLQLEHDI